MVAPAPKKPPELHDVVALFPVLGPKEREDLAERIKSRGVKVPIVIWKDPSGTAWVVDGRHRKEISEELGVTCPSEEFVGSFEEMVDHVMDLNFGRRHLPIGQRVAIALKAGAIKSAARNPDGRTGRPAGTDRAASGRAREAVAKVANAGSDTVARGARVARERPDLLDDVAAGTRTLNDAYKKTVLGNTVSAQRGNGKEDKNSQPPDEGAFDLVGHRVPEHLVEAFEIVGKIEDLAREISKIRPRMKEVCIAGEPGADYLSRAIVTIDAELKNAAAEARSARPYTICPACKGKPKGCPGCKQLGWITEPAFKRGFPDDVREKHIATAERRN